MQSFIFKTRVIKYLFLVASVFVLFLGEQAFAATLSVSPQTGVYTVGGIFSVQVRINTQGSAINAAEGTLRFDSQKLSVVSVSKGSIFNLWTADPSFSNTAGTVSFGGGSPAGYTGTAGNVMSVTFRAKTAGDTNVRFSSGSVLAADGMGTNVLASMGSAAFTIVANDVPATPEVIEYIAPANTPAAPVITSTTHPNASAWYTTTNAELSWNLPAGITAVRTLLDNRSGSIPTKVYETPIDSISIPDLDEGISYFHLQFKNADGWGRVAHYRLAVDTQDPTKFEISRSEDSDISNPVQTLLLTAEDIPSGVSRYLIQLDGGDPYEFIDETGSSTVTLPSLDPGHHSVIIEAFDAAGNSRIATYSFDILAFDKPTFTEYPSRINGEVIPVIKGLTRPNAEVVVTVAPVGGTQIEYIVQSNENGEFVFIPDGYFQNGVYELWAVATDAFGAQSDPSDTIRIAVEEPGYIQIGSFIVSVLSIIVPLIGLLLLLILSLLYFVRKIRTIRTVVVAETAEALTVLKNEFSAMSQALDDQKKILTKSRKTKKLTRAENDLIDVMHAAMDASLKRVSKEIDDVDDIVT